MEEPPDVEDESELNDRLELEDRPGGEGQPQPEDPPEPVLTARKADKFKFPRAIDPGWATVLASTLALIGTLAALVMRNQPQAPAPTATPAQVVLVSPVVLAEPGPTATGLPPTPTSAPPTPTSEPPTPTVMPPATEPAAAPSPAGKAAALPTVVTMEGLSPSETELAQESASSIMRLGRTMPLIIRDPFDVNDYDWPEFANTFDRGVECEAGIAGQTYHVAVQSTATSGPAACMTVAPRLASNFFLSLDTDLAGDRNSDILIYYRYADEENFSYIILRPQTQMITLGVRQDGVDTTAIEKYVPDIRKTGPNQITLIMVGDLGTIFINEILFSTIYHESQLDEGQLHLGLRLNEADAAEELLIDNFELRGDL